MRNAILTLAATCAMLAGGMIWTDNAEARPWGYAYRAPVVRYYYGPTYYRPYYGYRYYGPRYYYGYRPYYYGTPYFGGRVYYRYY